jgi:hypothetical protein
MGENEADAPVREGGDPQEAFIMTPKMDAD